MANMTDKAYNDPLGAGLDVFGQWANYQMKKEKAEKRDRLTGTGQGTVVGAHEGADDTEKNVNITEANNELMGMQAFNERAEVAGIELNKGAIYVTVAVLLGLLVYKVVA